MHLPDGEVMSIFDASVKYIAAGVPLVVPGRRRYGTGSSRDWAAKGTSCWASRRSSPSRSSAFTAAIW